MGGAAEAKFKTFILWLRAKYKNIIQYKWWAPIRWIYYCRTVDITNAM